MSSRFPNGTVFAISTTRGTPRPVSGVSNADPGVATSAGHGLTDGEIGILSVTSTRLDGRVARIDSLDANTFAVSGINTSSTTLYPSGFGVGEFIPVAGFVQISQTTDVTSGGGEQQFADWVYLEDGKQRRRKTFKNARSLQLTLDYDPDLAWHRALLDADDDGETRALTATMPNGDLFVWSVEVSYSGEPTFTINRNQQVTAVFSLVSQESTRYAA